MFSYADQDKDGQISFSEFQVMINPPRPKETVRPDIVELHSKTGPAGRRNNGVSGGEKKKPERRRTIVENGPVPSTVQRTKEPKQQDNNDKEDQEGNEDDKSNQGSDEEDEATKKDANESMETTDS